MLLSFINIITVTFKNNRVDEIDFNLALIIRLI